MLAEAAAAAVVVVWVAAAGLEAVRVTMCLETIRIMSRRRTRSDRLSLPDLSRV
jgi:hypothetical protein